MTAYRYPTRLESIFRRWAVLSIKGSQFSDALKFLNLFVEIVIDTNYGGHASRISRGARHAAEKQLRKIGFTDEKQIAQVIQDARDMASLERLADA